MLLIEPDWLASRLQDPSIRIFDCTTHMRAQPVGPSRIESGRPEFEASHIEGAQHLDMVEDLSSPHSPYAFEMLGPASFQSLMRKRGVEVDDHVVLYGRSALTTITRAWLVFYANGHRRISILNGGLNGWVEAGYPLSTAINSPRTSQYIVATDRPAVIADMDVVKSGLITAELNQQRHQLINALSPEQFRGTGGANYGRVGRIPTSLNLPARHLFDLKTQRFKTIDDIRQCWEEAGLDPSLKTIHYCGGGIAASTTAFTQALLGHDDWAVYDRSLLEWCHQSDTPMVTD
jgi:thiosulfate/3-mercaptopyruvate sulfurtransferase